MYDYKSLIETSLEVELSKTSTFELQIRIFDALECFDSDKLLQGVVQVDEKYERISFKGFSKEKMPRSSRHNGKDKHVSGISNDQICIVVAIDENDYIVIKVVGNGNASTSMISKAMKLPGSRPRLSLWTIDSLRERGIFFLRCPTYSNVIVYNPHLVYLDFLHML